MGYWVNVEVIEQFFGTYAGRAELISYLNRIIVFILIVKPLTSLVLPFHQIFILGTFARASKVFST